MGMVTHKLLHYKNSPIHRVVKHFAIIGGDITSGTCSNK